MDFLKWLLKASFLLALMFLGLKSEPKKDDPQADPNQKTAQIRLLGL